MRKHPCSVDLYLNWLRDTCGHEGIFDERQSVCKGLKPVDEWLTSTSPEMMNPNRRRMFAGHHADTRGPKRAVLVGIAIARLSKRKSRRLADAPRVKSTRSALALDHVGVRVVDIAAATRLYTAMLAPLGIVQHADGGFGPVGGVATLWLYEDSGGGGVHLAFAAPDRQAVAAFHAAGVAAGATDHGAPGLRVEYSPTYYAAFLLDETGNNLEAVCMQP